MPKLLPPSLALALLLAGCGANGPWAEVPPPLDAESQALADAVSDVSFASRESFNQEVAELPAEPAPGYRLQATLADPPTAVVENGFYTGPYPAAGALPAGYKVRPAGGWLKMNPSTRNWGEGWTSTSTYWTPDGTSQASAAQTLEARMGNTVVQDLYVTPNTTVSDLPTWFKDKLTLPAQYEVLQAEETYKVYNNGALSGPANGYRWLVLDGDKQSWIRALQVTWGKTKVDHFNVSSDYAMWDGALRPLHTTYATHLTGSGIGYGFERWLDIGTGRATAKGNWQNTHEKSRLDIAETTEPDGASTRVLTRTLDFGEVLELTENYRSGSKAGSGTVKVNGSAIGTLSWDSRYQGKLTIGTVWAPYWASRKSASQRSVALDLRMRVALPKRVPTTYKGELPFKGSP